jgi:hypothetical protein
MLVVNQAKGIINTCKNKFFSTKESSLYNSSYLLQRFFFQKKLLKKKQQKKTKERIHEKARAG